MHRRTFLLNGSLLAFMGTMAGCSTKATTSSENDEIVIRATNYSDSTKQIMVVGESSEGGDAFFTKQLALLGNAEETQVVATVNPQEEHGGDDTLTTIVVTVESGETRAIEYNPDPGNEDVDLRIDDNVIAFNYD